MSHCDDLDDIIFKLEYGIEPDGYILDSEFFKALLIENGLLNFSFSYKRIMKIDYNNKSKKDRIINTVFHENSQESYNSFELYDSCF